MPPLAGDGYLLMRDFRLALRQLRKAPGFSLAIVVTLALGIGGTTAIFSLVEGVLLRPLPFRDPQHLVLLGDRLGDGPQLGVTGSEVATYEHVAQAFSSIGAYFNTSWELSGGPLSFGRAQHVAAQNAFSEISYLIYKDKPEAVDPDAVVRAAIVHQLVKLSPGTYFWASFGHLSEYSSNYYTYMFDKVIAEDFFSQFDPNNPLAGDVPMRYRRLVLEPGGSMSANDLVKNFLGRPQNTKAFEHWMGEEFQSAPSSAQAR